MPFREEVNHCCAFKLIEFEAVDVRRQSGWRREVRDMVICLNRLRILVESMKRRLSPPAKEIHRYFCPVKGKVQPQNLR